MKSYKTIKEEWKTKIGTKNKGNKQKIVAITIGNIDKYGSYYSNCVK